MTNTRIIKTDRAYGAVNDYPEALGDPVGLIAAILRGTPRLAGAACVGQDPSLWFPDSKDHAGITAAARICAGCPARVDCNTYAVRAGEPHGIWGGHERGAGKRAPATHCRRNHEWTEENTAWRERPNGSGYRICRTCETGRNRRKLSKVAERKGVVYADAPDCCSAGHALDDTNLRWRRANKHGVRYWECKTCKTNNVRAFRERKKAAS